jgi:Na+/citrate or Na+/malate symporter
MFLAGGIIIMIAVYTGNVKDSMVFGFAILLFLGLFLSWLGNLNKYFRAVGGSALLCLFVPAILNLFNLIPEKTLSVITNFYSGYNFLDVCLAAWTAGCILGMDRELLIKASVRYALPMLGALAFCALGGGLIGAVTGYGSQAGHPDHLHAHCRRGRRLRCGAHGPDL